MDTDIYALVGKYGFKTVHCRLVEIMRQEYDFLHGHFESILISSKPALITDIPVKQEAIVTKKSRKQNIKKMPEVVKATIPIDTVLLSPPYTTEVKDVIVTLNEKGFRDPKEVKEFQKTAEEAKRKENDIAGIQIFQILTKENLKKWVEDEGRTYAWVAREKAGCADTQVAATAQMMGIKSKITKKRGMIINGK